MQLTAGARGAEPTVTVHDGFTLVEEDDVAFTLSLCRQVHRLYGLYQDGELPPAPNLEAGLQATIEMLAVVNRSVTTGMPAMRITVAAAQVTEMLAVLFDADPMSGPPRRAVADLFRARSVAGASRVALEPAAAAPEEAVTQTASPAAVVTEPAATEPAAPETAAPDAPATETAAPETAAPDAPAAETAANETPAPEVADPVPAVAADAVAATAEADASGTGRMTLAVGNSPVPVRRRFLSRLLRR